MTICHFFPYRCQRFELLSPDVACSTTQTDDSESSSVHQCNCGEKEVPPATLPFHVMRIVTACILREIDCKAHSGNEQRG